MKRGRPPGRGRGAPRGRVSFASFPIEEIFQDPDSEEDDLAAEELGFVVSSPKSRMIVGDDAGDKPADPINSDSIVVDPVKEENPNFLISEEATKSKQDVNCTIQRKLPGAVQEKKTWANVVGNRDSSKGIQLNFVPLSVDGIVEFTEEDIAAGVSAWSNAIIGQIIGENPKFKEIVGFVHRAWSRIEIPRIHQLQAGVFLFNFQSEESKTKIMSRNWSFKQEPWILSDWSPDYKPETKKPTTRKVWIRLPDLKLQFWTKQGIEKIVSGVGKPLSTDFLTANKDAIKFARVLVDIDLLKPYPSDVKCKLPNGTFYTQKIEYEGLPEPPTWDFGQQKDITSKGKEVFEKKMAPAAATTSDKATSAPETLQKGSIDANSGSFPEVADTIVDPETNQKKKNRKKKKKENTPDATNSDVSPTHVSSKVVIGSKALIAAGSVPARPSTTRDATVGQENATSTATEVEVTVGQVNATSTATEVQEKGIPNAASPVNEEGVPDPNKTKRNRKPNVRIWT